MRPVDLAVYADTLAARASTVAARLARARDDVRQAAIEREARLTLRAAVVERLESSGVLGHADISALRDEASALAEDLEAIEELQAWVEARLFDACEEAA